MRDDKSIEKLHLGCGLVAPEGWINVDGSWNARIARFPTVRNLALRFGILSRAKAMVPWGSEIFIHDVRKRLPFEGCRFRAIYTSHLLEHLYLSEADDLLCECLRVLKPMGVLRVVVPDLSALVERYIQAKPGWSQQSSTPIPPADEFNTSLLLRPSSVPGGGLAFRVYSLLKDFHTHKWIYDADSLIHHLLAAGFEEVAARRVHESRIENIRAIEQPSRILGGAGVCIEGLKPRHPLS
jgi:SAM-dependent methyltransferase